MSQTFYQMIENSPFKNIYWFSRYLMNTDQYGALGKTKETQLLAAISILENIMAQEEITEEEKLVVCKNAIASEIKGMVKVGTKTAGLALNLINILDKEIKSLEDVVIFCITMRYVVAPINQAIAAVPSDDVKFCEKAAASILDALGEERAGLVIETWDTLGVKGCLDVERTVVVEEFMKLIENLNSLNIIEHSKLDDNLVLTAFVQEFERRLGQKRKSRGGNSLENVIY